MRFPSILTRRTNVPVTPPAVTVEVVEVDCADCAPELDWERLTAVVAALGALVADDPLATEGLHFILDSFETLYDQAEAALAVAHVALTDDGLDPLAPHADDCPDCHPCEPRDTPLDFTALKDEGEHLLANDTYWTTIAGRITYAPGWPTPQNRYRRTVTTTSFVTREDTVERWIREGGVTKLIPGTCGDTIVSYGHPELVRDTPENDGALSRDEQIEAIAQAWNVMNPDWLTANARREIAGIALDALDAL